MAAFKDNVIRVIESHSKEMVNMNRVQMLNSKGAQDNPLIHRSTKSEYLTKPYAKRTGKSKPNLLVNGDFQNGMQMFVPSEKEYFISSKDYKSGYLEKNYGYEKSIFGVGPEAQPKAREVNDGAIVNDYMKTVFQ
jgi:hypothetical protein